VKKLSVHEFKNWISQQGDMVNFFSLDPQPKESVSGLVGKTVYAKVSPKKLLERIEIQDGENEKRMIQEFRNCGGEVLAHTGKSLLIKIDSGTFLLPRFCVSE